ncbi:hypothetical protein ACFV24_02460 [Nocardia fluminea]|uniref:hypothetical protein n=1 Tax=Nocardia fluminea TaxID=134984 RepID=UPI00366FF11F
MPWYQTVQIVVLTVVAVVTLPSAVHKAYSGRLRDEEKVKRLVDLTDKLPADAVGRGQIEKELGRATLDLAFSMQYPKSIRDRAPVFLTVAVILLVAFYLVLYIIGQTVFAWIVILFSYVGNYMLLVAQRNITENDMLIRVVFEKMHAPEGLVRQKPSLFVPWPRIGYGDIFVYAANVRDRSAEPMSTIESINLAIPLARKDIKFFKSRRRKYRWKLIRLRFQAVKLHAHKWILRLRTRRTLIFNVPLRRLQIKIISKRYPDRGHEISVAFEKVVSEIRDMIAKR